MTSAKALSGNLLIKGQVSTVSEIYAEAPKALCGHGK